MIEDGQAAKLKGCLKFLAVLREDLHSKRACVGYRFEAQKEVSEGGAADDDQQNNNNVYRLQPARHNLSFPLDLLKEMLLVDVWQLFLELFGQRRAVSFFVEVGLVVDLLVEVPHFSDVLAVVGLLVLPL